MASLCLKSIVDLFSKYPGSLVARKPCKSQGEARLRFWAAIEATAMVMPRSLFSSAGTTSKNASLDEYTVDVRDLTRWSLPKVPSKHIYDLGSFTLAWSHLVKTLEQTITVEETHARCLNWANSLMGVMETSLTNGPVYFNIYPDLALSMTDPHLLKALSLNLITHNYEFQRGSETIAIVYRIYYRVLNTLASHVKIASEKGKTTLVESNILSTKTAIPRTLRWDEIEFPSTWQMAEATVPQPLDNREVEQIVQDADGNVEITFAPNLRRKIPLITAGRRSTGSIPSETTSQPEMEGLTTDSFGNFQPIYNRQHWQLNTGAVIKSVFPPKEALTIQGVKGASMAIVHPVETTSTPTTTELLQAVNQLVKQGNFANLTLEAVGKQLQQMEGKINQLLAQKAAKPTYSEASTSKQVIKSPLIHPPMKLEMLPEDRTADLLEKFLEKIGSRQINTLPEKPAYQQTLPSSSQAVHVKQEHSRVSPSRLQPFDLNTEENPLVYANSYDAKVIYEWNIDNPTPKKIVAGLSGDLYGWWYNYLDEPYRNHILYAVKTDVSRAPLLDSEEKPISDAVMSLLVSIVSNFSWDPSRQTETTKYLLHNIRCRTLTDLNWYITTFRSTVMTLPDAANPYWKQRFIEGLPTQFATKVKEGLRQNPNEEVNWNALHYGHLQAACTQQGLALCNDLRLKKQLKQDHISAKTLGEFCKQFAFDPVPVNRSKDKQLSLETDCREPKTESSKYCDNHYTMPALYKRLQKQTASPTPPDLQKEIKVCKQEIQELKTAYYQLSARIEALEQPASPVLQSSPKGESSHRELQPEIIPVQKATEQNLHQMLQSIIQQKWYVLISVFIQGKLVLRNVVALVDSGVDLNCIREGVLPLHFLQPSTETLNSAC
ncbi:hypothetical protein H6P81_014004 [Aristolochia fimbriata]|uniref:Peptidase A2 domain-containing protein n=1 Tax=Aristolochia fimbriata TaxID=158543 RepID=A0AAV7EHH0_ARIFI|nr:hypothetical protein H6P81_014004 [Aristolochia fimbriata]